MVSTFQYAGTGYDLPRLDTLVLAQPVTGRVKQAIGRVTREFAGGKTQPVLVVDVQDEVANDYDLDDVSTSMSKKRQRLVRKELPNIQVSNHEPLSARSSATSTTSKANSADDTQAPSSIIATNQNATKLAPTSNPPTKHE